MSRRVRRWLFLLSRRHEWIIQIAFFALLPLVYFQQYAARCLGLFASISPDYPPLYHARLRRARRRILWLTPVSGLFALVYGAGYFWFWPLPWVEAAPVFVAPFIAWMIAVPSWWADVRDARVLPYFRKGQASVPATTFLSGGSLAREWNRVETIARQQGAQPLSSFGLADDAWGETLEWHAAEQGLKTIGGLLKAEVIASDSSLTADLRAIRDALEAAQRLDVPFCLVLRNGNGWNSSELDARQGSFGSWPT